jgi:1-acyl-sn-glycerol-3-phosphate acyltransferase
VNRRSPNAILSALTWAAIAVLVLAALPVLAVVRLLDRDPAHYATGRLFRALGGLLSRVSPAWRVVRSGRVPADMRRPYVVVANHQSNADIPVISRLPWEMKWVAKAELFRFPVVGWMLRLAGDIPVDRADRRSRVLVVRQARHYLDRRCSVMFMPEGTRSKDGRVKAFQDGAFRLAIEAGVPVLPLAIDGTAGALPKDGWQFGQADVRLHVLAPIETAGLTPEDAPALRERVRQAIIAQVAAWRGVPPSAVDGAAGPPEGPVAEPGAGPSGAVEEAANRPPEGAFRPSRD